MLGDARQEERNQQRDGQRHQIVDLRNRCKEEDG